jgi:nucleoside-diphosphate-sugar epimerase
MEILVTGGTGFIGSHLVERLQAKGDRVRCLVRTKSHPLHIDTNGVELFYGDLLRKESLEPAVKGVDAVVHLAAVQGGTQGKEQFFQVNVTGTKNLIEAASRFAPNLRKFVHVSSISAVGPRDDTTPLTEESPCAPVDFYGESKLAAEEAVLDYRKKVPLLTVRPPLVYGPRDSNRFGLLRYAKIAKRGFRFMRGDAETYTSIIHVSDLCEGLIKAVETRRAEGEKYFLCNEHPASYGDIAGWSAAALQRSVKEIVIPSFILDTRAFIKALYGKLTGRDALVKRQGLRAMPRHWICDGSKAQRELEFEPVIPLPEGIRETVLWYRDRGWL